MYTQELEGHAIIIEDLKIIHGLYEAIAIYLESDNAHARIYLVIVAMLLYLKKPMPAYKGKIYCVNIYIYYSLSHSARRVLAIQRDFP